MVSKCRGPEEGARLACVCVCDGGFIYMLYKNIK